MTKEDIRAEVQCILVHDRKHDKGGCKLFHVGEKFKKRNFNDKQILVSEWIDSDSEWAIKSIVKL